MRENLVVDTNVLVSAALKTDGSCAEVLKEVYAEYQIIQSMDTFSEIAEVLTREKFDHLPGRTEFLQELAENAQFVEVTHETEACRDPKDNIFLELAVSGEADGIVAGDRHLLEMGQYQGIEIEKPREFLDRHYERMMDEGRSI